MKKLIALEKTFDWIQKRHSVEKSFQKYDNMAFIDRIRLFQKKKIVIKSWYLYKINRNYISFIKYIKLYKHKKKLFKKFYNFILQYNGLYKIQFLNLIKLRIFFIDTSYRRHCVLKFIFTSQQIFFQLYTKNPAMPDTHTTVGSLIRVRENVREHGGEYVYRWNDTSEAIARERARDKKWISFFRFKSYYDNVRRVYVKKALMHTSLKESKEQQLLKAKKELIIKKLKKKNKSTENIVMHNRRGNPKTEPLFGKSQRRRFNTWLWFIKSIALYLVNKRILILRTYILSITGLIKNHKQIIKYILYIFRKMKIILFLLKINLKYRGAKLKHYTTVKKKARKRIIKTEYRWYNTF